MDAVPIYRHGNVPYALLESDQEAPESLAATTRVLRVCRMTPYADVIRIATRGPGDLLTILMAWNQQPHWYYAAPAPDDVSVVLAALRS